MKNKKKENALFLQRFVAFILDIMMVSVVVSLISFPFLNTDSIQKLNDESVQIMDRYMKQKINIEAYMTESVDVSYELAKQNGAVSLMTIFLNILYFVVFQFYKKGQTIGKKIMRIRVVSSEGGELTMNQMIFRASIINFILADMLALGFIIFGSKAMYFYGVGTIELVQYSVMIISVFMIMFSKSRRGIHDLVAHTRVVRSDEVKELEVCES